jgi:hypothetical protein
MLPSLGPSLAATGKLEEELEVSPPPVATGVIAIRKALTWIRIVEYKSDKTNPSPILSVPAQESHGKQPRQHATVKI